MRKISEYLTIGQAAEHIGVTPNTMRNLAHSGKLKPYTNPLNGYRLYAKEDLDALLGNLNNSK